ncbi:glycerophosphoryl diester phosphodiesterase membrane domain-containing protein [Trueperella sp. LYQ143]|uniref:glycerophosphoryl diester phosphodiesterase membrane domain-containing protein n=1 Tax=unclassified Trueperella TaxID=2630174 RepID=UPI003983C605
MSTSQFFPPPNGHANTSGMSYGQYGSASDNIGKRAPAWRTVIPMRPLSVGETIDAAVRLIRFNPVAFIVFPIVVHLVVLAGYVACLFVLRSLPIRDSFNSTFNMVTIPVGILSIGSMIAGMLTWIAGARVTLASMRGTKMPLSATFRSARSGFWRFTGRFIVLTLISCVVLLAAIIVCSLLFFVFFLGSVRSLADLHPVAIIIFTIIATLASLIGSFLIFARFIAVLPTMVIEDIGPIAAIRRSWNLTKHSLGYLIGVFIAIVILSSVLSTVATGVLMLIAGSTSLFMTSFVGAYNPDSSVLNALLTGVTMLLFAGIVSPIYNTLINMVYINMRMRREQFHQQFLYEAGQQAAHEAATAQASASPANWVYPSYPHGGAHATANPNAGFYPAPATPATAPYPPSHTAPDYGAPPSATTGYPTAAPAEASYGYGQYDSPANGSFPGNSSMYADPSAMNNPSPYPATAPWPYTAPDASWSHTPYATPPASTPHTPGVFSVPTSGKGNSQQSDNEPWSGDRPQWLLATPDPANIATDSPEDNL